MQKVLLFWNQYLECLVDCPWSNDCFYWDHNISLEFYDPHGRFYNTFFLHAMSGKSVLNLANHLFVWYYAYRVWITHWARQELCVLMFLGGHTHSECTQRLSSEIEYFALCIFDQSHLCGLWNALRWRVFEHRTFKVRSFHWPRTKHLLGCWEMFSFHRLW